MPALVRCPICLVKGMPRYIFYTSVPAHVLPSASSMGLACHQHGPCPAPNLALWRSLASASFLFRAPIAEVISFGSFAQADRKFP